MHRFTTETDAIAQAVVGYALDRIKMDPPPLDGPATLEELRAAAGETITADGIGGEEALRVFADVLAPATLSTDHPRNWAFVPAAPTEASVLFDLVVGASSIIGSTWIDGAGAIYAENQAIRWLLDLAGFPGSSGGVFVSGGSAGNLSALVTARDRAMRERQAAGRERPARWTLAATEDAHSSVWSAAKVMDVDVLAVPTDERARLTGEALENTLQQRAGDLDGLFAVVATGGTTNAGIVDDLEGVRWVAQRRGLWLHVDGAYGGAALAAPSARALFTGIEHADSVVIDPHKLLFAPFDCAALLYRDPLVAARAHMQEAAYLDEVTELENWNPSHYAYHLTRRVRGLPFWFSLATHGTAAYRDAVEAVLQLTREAADEIRGRDGLELLEEPEISVVLFKRDGWGEDRYLTWCDELLDTHTAFALPTTWHGEKVMRFCFVNPVTTIEDVRVVLDTM
ncbi:MAG: pyridoxal-dependent decarboxylase [Actinomycetota bacterium]